MLTHIFYSIPEKVKVLCDVAAGVGGATAVLGLTTGFFGAIAAVASSIYAVLRLYYYILDRRNHRARRS